MLKILITPFLEMKKNYRSMNQFLSIHFNPKKSPIYPFIDTKYKYSRKHQLSSILVSIYCHGLDFKTYYTNILHFLIQLNCSLIKFKGNEAKINLKMYGYI